MVYGNIELLTIPYICVSWNLTDFCNNSCWYCLNKKCDYQLLTKRKIDLFLSKLFKLKYKIFDFLLVGGEPLLCNLLPYVINILKKEKRVNKIKIITAQVSSILTDNRIIPIVTIHPSVKQLIDYSPVLENKNSIIQLALDTKYAERTIFLYEKFKNDNIIPIYLRKPPFFNEYLTFSYFSSLVPIPEIISYKNKYCIQGTTCIKVFSDMSCVGAICNQATTFRPNIVQCHEDACNCETNSLLIKTDTLDEANYFLEEFKSSLL